MPDYTVKADVDTMLRAANNAAIRSAIGVGTTDAPTFLAQTLTGQNLTGTQATSLVDLATTWNTTGNPSLIYGRVTNTNSGTTANLIDLGTFAGGSLFKVNKEGLLALPASGGNGGGVLCGGSVFPTGSSYIGQYGVRLASDVQFSWSSGTNLNTLDLNLYRDAAGILAQRNGVNAQAFRVYNTYTDASNYERGGTRWGSNVLELGTEASGTGTGRDVSIKSAGLNLDLGTQGGARWRISSSNLLAVVDNTYDIGASGANRPRNVFLGGYVIAAGGTGGGYYAGPFGGFAATAAGVFLWVNGSSNDFDRFNLGGTSNANPAIARDGAGIKFTGAAAGSTSWIKVPAVAVSALPSAATAGVGARAFVNDALTPVFGSAVANGGSATVPVYSTGSAWNVG